MCESVAVTVTLFFYSSREDKIRRASSRDLPQNKGSAWNPSQTLGRSGEPNIRQRLSSVRFMHLTPAGFPLGIPGIGDEIEGAMQQAPHPNRQGMN